jgi:hypothetical protein
MAISKYKELLVYGIVNVLGVQHLLEFSSRQEALDYVKVEECLDAGHLMKATLLAEGMKRKYGPTKTVLSTQAVLRTLRRKRNG